MKVIVGKMPGGRATEVEIPEGGTVLEAIKAAGYEQELNNGFEARMNNAQTELSSTVPVNAIITLTSKIIGNAISAISVVPVGTDAEHEKFVVLTPTIIHDFINIPDVKDMLLRLKKTVLHAPIKCIIADPVNLKVSKPIEIVIHGETVICADFTYAINAGNYVVFCNEDMADKIYRMDFFSAVSYIEEYLPEESRNPESLAASQIPEEAKEIEVTEDNLEEASEGHCGNACASEAKEFKHYCGPKEENPCCDPSECCEDCDEEVCGECHKEFLPEDMLTIAEMVAMCKRLGIDVSLTIPGSFHSSN